MRQIMILAVTVCVAAGCAGPDLRTPPPREHVLKGSDLMGCDPVTLNPTESQAGKQFSEKEAIDLTFLKIVKDNELVGKLNVFDLYMKPGTKHLGSHERRYADQEMQNWSREDQQLYFRAAAIVINRIHKLNPDIDSIQDLKPGTRIVLPDPAIF